MTRKERTALRDRARKDFEGKTYENTFIFETSISIFDSGEVHIILLDEYMEGFYDFNVSQYDKVLSECKKYFPKDGFYIEYKNLSNKEYKVCKFVANIYQIDGIHLNTKGYPEVTIEELKKEAIRIIKTI